MGRALDGLDEDLSFDDMFRARGEYNNSAAQQLSRVGRAELVCWRESGVVCLSRGQADKAAAAACTCGAERWRSGDHAEAKMVVVRCVLSGSISRRGAQMTSASDFAHLTIGEESQCVSSWR